MGEYAKNRRWTLSEYCEYTGAFALAFLDFYWYVTFNVTDAPYDTGSRVSKQ